MKRNELKTVHELTPKQRMFVEILVQEHGNITQHEAYKRAGYEAANENTAKSCASQLLSRKLNPHVAKFYDQRFEQEVKKYESDNLRRFKRLERIADKAEKEKQYAAAINAEYRSGQWVRPSRRDVLNCTDRCPCLPILVHLNLVPRSRSRITGQRSSNSW
jgi:phage terminase small subunit